MSILINQNTRVITQGITGKTGQFHTQTSRDYANGQACYVAGVNPRKAGQDFEGIPIFGSVVEAKQQRMSYRGRFIGTRTLPCARFFKFAFVFVVLLLNYHFILAN